MTSGKGVPAAQPEPMSSRPARSSPSSSSTTGPTRARIYTDTEKVSPTYGSGAVDGSKWFGSTPGSASGATARYLIGAWFTGSNAERLSTDANAKALLEALGWTVSGY